MIIECVNCSKKFDVNSDLIPSAGRTIQCGSCNHVWFYKKGQENQSLKNEIKSKDDELSSKVIQKNKPKIKDIQTKNSIMVHILLSLLIEKIRNFCISTPSGV